ncbi:flagellar basal body rod protein FlgG [Mesobacillus campisalis]|uniref:Flagellar basal body rod protein FlgG n=1 Tax=Mesobacillus campisalis TaxID=1408103 RepID=A0A0M2SZ54_9BACI|nr:flagellar hook-basal body protein [Mesobacillus campisalis]KKK38991.1 flagellar basal body rod protein FlgG [Mesobacillus campisalis]
MFRGLYTATSGMMAHNRKQQILTNNLENASTPGFKQDQTALRAFPAQLLRAANGGSSGNGAAALPGHPYIGTLHTGVYVQEGTPSFIPGPLKQTGNTTDLALLDESLPVNPETQEKGTLLFAVALDDNQIRYTRNGQFAMSEDGLLTTSEGHPVLDQNLQPIQVQSNEFTVSADGELSSDGQGNGRLWIGYTEQPEQMVKEGHGLLRWAGNPEDGPQAAEDVEFLNNAGNWVKQGFIEQSNVDITQTMTEMITTYRGFESNQKVIQAYDRSMEKTVNEIGRV